MLINTRTKRSSRNSLLDFVSMFSFFFSSELKNHHADLDHVLDNLKIQFGHDLQHIVPELHSSKHIVSLYHWFYIGYARRRKEGNLLILDFWSLSEATQLHMEHGSRAPRYHRWGSRVVNMSNFLERYFWHLKGSIVIH